MTTRNRAQHPAAVIDGVAHATSEVSIVDEGLLTITEVAAILRAPVATLRYWRHLGTGPRSFRVGRGIRYRRTDVSAWLQTQQEADNAGGHASASRR